jgi:hypothetical protein
MVEAEAKVNAAAGSPVAEAEPQQHRNAQPEGN